MSRFDSTFTEKELQSEEWRSVVGYEGLYEISNLGRLKRLRAYGKFKSGRILRLDLNNGYLRVSLCQNGKERQFAIHRLVATSFLGPCPEGNEINHIDHDRANNRVGNLEYMTHQENINHALENDRLERGERRYNAKLTNAQAREIRGLLRLGLSQRKIAARFGVTSRVIWRINNGVGYSDA